MILDEIEYTFNGPDDARAYLREVGLLWSVWVLGLIAVLVTHGFALVLVAVGLLAILIRLARPLLPRTEGLVPVNTKEGGVLDSALRGGTTRDRVLRELAYGTTPIRAALDAAGLSPRWIGARHLVIAVTLFAFVGVLVVPLL
jgi:hypothetical protein